MEIQRVHIVSSQADREYITRLAVERQAIKQQTSHLTPQRLKRVDPNRRDLELTTVGLAAECAVAYLLGVAIDANHYVGRGDGGRDLVKNGKRYQVKYNHTPHGDLYFRFGYPLTGWDYCVLTVGTLDAITVVGWMDQPGFTRLKVHKTYGYNQVWAVPQDLLYPIETLPGYTGGVQL